MERRPGADGVREARAENDARGSIWLAARPGGGTGGGLRLDPPVIARTRHALAEHPLLQYSELSELARSLSGSSHVRLAPRDATIGTPFRPLVEAQAGRTVAEALDSLHLPGTWIALYHLEEIPAYRQLVGDALAGVLRATNGAGTASVEVGGFVFIAGPRAVWPFHFDREHNFHVQLKGTKHYKLWPPGDPLTLSPLAIEQVFTRSDCREVRYRDELGPRCHSFSLRSGEGVHIPSTSALSISTADVADPGGGPAISMALTYFPRPLQRAACVHTANEFLRTRVGVEPRPPGRSPLADAVKYPVGRALELAQRRGWLR
jgi:hypothetical protein